MNETVSSNTNSIDGLRKNKLDASTFSNYTSNMSPIILKLSQGVSKNENDISGKAEKADVETMEKKLTALVGENTSNIKLKADKDFVSDEDDKLRLAIGKNQDAITDLSKSVNSKADKESVDDLSSTVSAMTSYIKASITNSATNRDLKTVSDKVDDLSYLVANKATLADFNIVSATSKSNSVAIDDLKHDKQERGDYVSATTMLNYYTKSETSGNTQIQDALDDKQDKGNYVEVTDLDNYYTKSETIDAYEFKGLSAKVTTDLETKANKDAVAQLSRNVDNCQNEIEKALNDLTLLDNDMHTKYTTKSYVDNTVDAVSSGVSANSNLISKISDINNLKLYDPTKGSFIDDGNGLLDVLHRKFHLLIKGIDETNTSIEGYLCNLEKRIKAIEDKNK
ncbi:unknown [Prevotella sp. CAG:1092]|nr:unknown [Prevotella sp. CAG:1092]